MRIKVLGFVLAIVFFSNAAVAATDIGLGTLRGIKLYDLGSSQFIRVVFNDDVMYENVSCSKIAKVTYADHDKEFVDRFISMAMAAYMSGKKVRIVSESNDCEASFIALQETKF